MGFACLQILVINPGSSSIKFAMFQAEPDGLRAGYKGELNGIGTAEAKLSLRGHDGTDYSERLAARLGGVKAHTMTEAIGLVERTISLERMPKAEAVGYRVVHPGPRLRGHQRVTPEVIEDLKAATEFAPLHTPAAVEMIGEMLKRWPGVPHFACFDTVFHETMPEEATTYALPEAVRAKGVRRFGFHGLSCESIVWQMRESMQDAAPRRMVIAHLGSGSSVTMCVEGRSVDTTMGLTPTGGVVMGTRPGDLDPGVIFWLVRQPGVTVESVEHMLNYDSGLKALGGVNDMRALRRAESSDAHATLALRIFCRSVAKSIAGYVGLFGADAIVFTGGIGEHDAASRTQIAAGLAGIGVKLDMARNSSFGGGIVKISLDDAGIAVYVAPAEEDRMIARHVARMCGQPM